MRTFIPGTYKHRRCLDLAIEVIKVSYRGPDYTKVRAALIRDTDGAMFWPDLVTLTIQKDEYENWKPIRINK